MTADQLMLLTTDQLTALLSLNGHAACTFGEDAAESVRFWATAFVEQLKPYNDRNNTTLSLHVYISSGTYSVVIGVPDICKWTHQKFELLRKLGFREPIDSRPQTFTFEPVADPSVERQMKIAAYLIFQVMLPELTRN